MAGHAVFAVTRTVAIVSLVALTGCSTGPTAMELAQFEIKYNSVDVASRLASLSSTLSAPAALTPVQLAQVTDNVAIDDTGAVIPAEPPALEVAFASSSDSQTITVRALMRGHGQDHRGFGGTAHSAYGCADFVADFSSRKVTARDAACPAWLSGWIGDAELTSVTAASEGALDDVVW